MRILEAWQRIKARRNACALLVFIPVLFLAGCSLDTINWSVKPSLTAANAKAKPLFDPNVIRGDDSATIDAELAKRRVQMQKKADALFTEKDGQLILKHKYGTTVIPQEAKRVVVIRLEDPMAALGTPMVGAYNPPRFYLHDELTAQDVVPISINENIKSINMEQVQALKPDLILLRDSFDRNTYVALSKIAPVAALKLQDSEVTLLALGRILHREKQAEERLQLYYDRVKEARMEIKSHIGNEPVALLRVMRKEVRLYPYSTNDINRFMYELLNLRPDPMAVAQDSAALGTPMVGAYNPPRFYLHDELTAQDVVPISINENIKSINMEQVQALKPDLILLRDSFDRNTYVALSKIAPVAALKLQDSEVTLLALGRILHREKQAEERLQLYYDRVKEARMEIKSHIGNEPVALLRVMRKEVRLYPYSTNDINRFMYELLNLRPDPMAVAQDSGDTNVVSLEMLPELKAEYLIVASGYGPSSSGNAGAAQKYYEELQADPLWQTIPAVKDGHVLNVNPVLWNAHGIIAKERAIEDLRRYLTTVK